MFLFTLNCVCDEPAWSMTTRVLVNLPPGIVSPSHLSFSLSVKSIRHKRVTSTAALCSPTLSLFHYSHHLLSLSCYSSVIYSAKPAVSHSQEAAHGALTFAWECSQKCRPGFVDGESIAAEDEQVRPNYSFFLQRSTTH